MRTRLLLAAAAVLTLAACSDSSTTPQLSPTKASREITCRSGFHIATREDGSESCEPDGDALYAAPGTTTPGTSASPATLATPPVAVPPDAPPPVPATPASPNE